MYEYKIVNVVEKIAEIRIEEQNWDIDIRELGVDSLSFIKLLVALECEMEKEIDYMFLDRNSIVSINSINTYFEKLI